jgi:hypothetical protein
MLTPARRLGVVRARVGFRQLQFLAHRFRRGNSDRAMVPAAPHAVGPRQDGLAG